MSPHAIPCRPQYEFSDNDYIYYVVLYAIRNRCYDSEQKFLIDELTNYGIEEAKKATHFTHYSSSIGKHIN